MRGSRTFTTSRVIDLPVIFQDFCAESSLFPCYATLCFGRKFDGTYVLYLPFNMMFHTVVWMDSCFFSVIFWPCPSSLSGFAVSWLVQRIPWSLSLQNLLCVLPHTLAPHPPHLTSRHHSHSPRSITVLGSIFLPRSLQGACCCEQIFPIPVELKSNTKMADSLAAETSVTKARPFGRTKSVRELLGDGKGRLAVLRHDALISPVAFPSS